MEAKRLIESCHHFISYRYDNIKSSTDWKYLSKTTKIILKSEKKNGNWQDESGTNKAQTHIVDSRLTKLRKDITLLKVATI